MDVWIVEITVYVSLILAIFWLQRVLVRRKSRRGRKWGFYPSTTALGNAFQTVQLFAQPEVRHVLAEKQLDADEDEEGDLEDMEKHLQKQLRRIRRGEDAGVLRVRSMK